MAKVRLGLAEIVVISNHTDVVGSLLRPTELLQARDELSAGRISASAFKAIEDRAVDDAVALQEDAGLPIVTDGEMRRLSFQSQLPEAVEGFGDWGLDAFLWGDWYGPASVGESHRPRPAKLGVTGKLRRKRHLSAEEFTYLRGRTRRVPKITIPSPSLWANFWSAEQSGAVYPTLERFLEDVVDILHEEVVELARLGATYIQIDAPHYPLLLDPATRAFYESQGWDLDRWLGQGIEMDNAVMSGLSEVTFGFHLCRGNQGSRWLVEGGYDLIAKPIFHQTHAQRLLLEYDDPRSGGFEPLRSVPDDKMVVLGLVTTKHPGLEAADQLVKRIQEASRFLPLDRLALSPQCGFGTSVVGNALTIDDQRQKLRLVTTTAARVWGQD